METNLYTMTIPPMRKMLSNLSGILDKANQHAHSKAGGHFTPEVHTEALLNERLVFDQFDLKRQIQIVSDNAKGGAARIAGIEPPVFEDTEKTIEELKARLEKTIAFLDTIKPEQVVGQEARPVTLPYWPDKPMAAFDYATEYLLPNFYFHAVTAYSILRKNGVDLGKADYMGSIPFTE